MRGAAGFSAALQSALRIVADNQQHEVPELELKETIKPRPSLSLPQESNNDF
jgi:hypothetical protein